MLTYLICPIVKDFFRFQKMTTFFKFQAKQVIVQRGPISVANFSLTGSQLRVFTVTEHRGNCPVQPFGYLNFTKVIFRQIITLASIKRWFRERPAHFNSLLSRENSTVVMTIFSAFFALRQSPISLPHSRFQSCHATGRRVA